MSLTNKIILCGLSAGFLWASAAQAEVKTLINQETAKPAAGQSADATAIDQVTETSKPEAILFRVENITPISNKEGITTQCSYIVTVYNRSDRTLKDAKLQLTWADSISGKYKMENNKLKVVSGEEAVSLIKSEVTLVNIAPHKQKSFEQRVETDKCYLLFDNTQFAVTGCDIEGLSKVDAGSCQPLFNYIDSKNPEYYSEFKDVPASVLQKQIEDEKSRSWLKLMKQSTQLLKLWMKQRSFSVN
jgi:hypothetical protein